MFKSDETSSGNNAIANCVRVPNPKNKNFVRSLSGFELFFSSRILAKVECVFPMVSTLRITDQMATRKIHPTLLSFAEKYKARMHGSPKY